MLAFSPDGRRIVYSTNQGLYLRSMGELEARLIPGTAEFLANPFFSSDGQSLAYSQGGQLKRIAISGGAPVLVTEVDSGLFGASWREDDTILYSTRLGIHRVSANGGAPELMIPAEAGGQHHGPQLLPDGDSLLFTLGGEGNWDVAWIVAQSLSTGERKVLIQGGSDAQYLPTGHLVYALSDVLFGVRFDANTLTVSGGAVPLEKVQAAPSGWAGCLDLGPQGCAPGALPVSRVAGG